ncbi:hypothetical protein F4821DRAFT_235349 [Hypoxylon rubiginosum]|uniref:Uncharacterized protein n=1 Tax=Hypoxylon rubiginosum TaxID=110542 RepID=A0ACC0D5P8_9PEZI|nr:hypothetical protein F4821DRAFT_235349 [Hypoxylon rubiginosum]
MALAFTAPPSSRKGDAWFCVGRSSSFPNITESGSVNLSQHQACSGQESAPGCKVFHVPDTDSSQARQIEGGSILRAEGGGLSDEVVVFKYKDKIHAISNRCPHSAYPLSEGIPFDIEDFGVVLSAGITCPKHWWSFDLFTGRADRSNYELRRWDVQLRPSTSSEADKDEDDQEVWVRRKQRIG